jgi:hypothetical protein
MKRRLGVLVAVGLLALMSAGNVEGQPAAAKAEASGTLTLGDKTYRFTRALAYEVTRFNKKQTVVILSEKPLDAAKLKQSLAKKGTDEDFFPFDAHLKLRFDDKGALAQSAIYAEGANILGSGDDNVKATIAIKDGAAKGQARMTKPDTFFKKSYQFDATFDVAVLQTPLAVAEAKPAAKPAVTPPVVPKAKAKSKVKTEAVPVEPNRPAVAIEKEERFEGTLLKDSPKVMNKAAKVHLVKMSPGKTYLIDLMSTEFDPYLRILDSTDTQLAHDDDGGENRNARLRFTPTKEDTYKIIVTRFGSREGKYLLKIALVR